MNANRALAIVLLLLAVPLTGAAQSGSSGAQAEADPITFYGHVFGNGLGLPMPANTEAPIGEDNYGIGLGINCEGATPALNECEDDEPGNKLALYSTAGFVQVDNRAEFLQNGAYAQFHNERGQTQDIQLDTSESIEASVYISLDAHGWAVGAFNPYGTNCVGPHPPGVPCLYPSWGWDPGVFHDVVVKATLYHADLGSRTNASAPPPVQEALESGEAEVLAEGQWGPDIVMNGIPGSPNVNEFAIDLGSAQKDTVPRSDDFFLVYSVYQESGGENYCLRCPARWWSGEFFPPTFTLPVENAFSVERVIPNFAHGKLAILGVMNTPWGSYDIDSDSVDLSIEGPNGQDIQPEAIDRFGDVSVAHGGHFKPINLTWIWDYQQDGIATGEYTVTVSASNFQNSASASCSATFTVEKIETRNGRERLAPGDVEEGLCGVQTASDELVEEIKEGASEEAE